MGKHITVSELIQLLSLFEADGRGDYMVYLASDEEWNDLRPMLVCSYDGIHVQSPICTLAAPDARFFGIEEKNAIIG